MPPTNSTTVNTALDARLKERFSQLPKVVQDAITSADVQKQMRELADKQNLHIDQWGKLENEVMLTLLGFEEPAELQKNIERELGLAPGVALSLAVDINTIVFEPVRQQLERELEHPSAQEKVVSTTEAARESVLATEHAAVAAPPVLPATPPPVPLTAKAVRAPLSSSYTSGQTSTERKIVEGDPYRLPPV